MDGATIQQRVWRGYAIAGAKIGTPFDLYRPTSATIGPLTGTKVTTLSASFNAEDMTYQRPNKYGSPRWFGLFDASQTQVGDYLTNGSSTYFIAGMQPLLPVLCVECSRVVSIARTQQNFGFGALGYSGNVLATETQIVTSWPASILEQTRGNATLQDLPSDGNAPYWRLLMPAPAGVVLQGGDMLSDDIDRRYVIGSAELTDLGWRMVVKQIVV